MFQMKETGTFVLILKERNLVGKVWRGQGLYDPLYAATACDESKCYTKKVLNFCTLPQRTHKAERDPINRRVNVASRMAISAGARWVTTAGQGALTHLSHQNIPNLIRSVSFDEQMVDKQACSSRDGLSNRLDPLTQCPFLALGTEGARYALFKATSVEQ